MAGGSLSIGDKIAGQMAARGWTQQSIEDTILNPSESHDVWDLTGGGREAATAYVNSDGAYVVVNDSTDQVVQISDANDPGWKPVWNDPRFPAMTIDGHDALWAHRLLIDACLQHRVPFFWRGLGTLLIARSGIRDVLQTVARSGEARILGLEGFELDGSTVRPRLDLIFDVERTPSQDPPTAVATWDDGVWIDVTLAAMKDNE